MFFDDFDPGGRRILVVGMPAGRDPTEMLAALRADEFDTVHRCTAPSPRGMPAARASAAAARALGCAEVHVHDTVERGLRPAMRRADADDAVLVTGSLYVVGGGPPGPSSPRPADPSMQAAGSVVRPCLIALWSCSSPMP